MKIKHVLTAALWLFCFFAPVFAQEEHPLRVKINDSIREHEPEWQIRREDPVTHSEEHKCDALVTVWAKGSARLLTVVYEHESKASTDATYKRLLEFHHFSDAREFDESYLGELHYTYVAMDGPGQWYPNGSSTLYVHLLRRGREVLLVVGDTPELVKKFSALIAAEFPAT